jgi:hypothetical protein
VKPELQARQTEPMQRSGKRPELARPSWAQIQLAAQLQHLGVVSAEVEPAKGRQSPDLSRSQLALPEIEP